MRWRKMRDKGHLDADGVMIILDRDARFATVGGETISRAVEEQIRRCPAELEPETVAIKIPDERKGEQILPVSAH